MLEYAKNYRNCGIIVLLVVRKSPEDFQRDVTCRTVTATSMKVCTSGSLLGYRANLMPNLDRRTAIQLRVCAQASVHRRAKGGGDGDGYGGPEQRPWPLQQGELEHGRGYGGEGWSSNHNRVHPFVDGPCLLNNKVCGCYSVWYFCSPTSTNENYTIKTCVVKHQQKKKNWNQTLPKVCGCYLVVFHVLQLLSIRFMSKNSCCIRKLQ